MNNNTRRSERLRRKRQSTPGLSQPGSYSLYGGGYVVESEASFLPPSAPQSATPKLSNRRLRYKDSPHRYAEDSPMPNQHTPTDNPDAIERRASAADKVRVSLFDILGSAARRPVSNSWRARAEAENEGGERVVDEVDEDQVVPALIQRDGFWTRHRAMIPVFAVGALLLGSVVLVIALETVVHSRQLPYFERAGKTPVWHGIRDTCVAATDRVYNAIPSLPTLPSRAGMMGGIKDMLSGAYNAAGAAVRYMMRGSRSSSSLRDENDYVSRTELESTILPKLISEARRTAAQEAARVTRELGPSSDVRGPDFNSFAEQYAADKGLPADYALLSVGASVDSSEPSVGWLYARFVRQYVEALVTEGAYTPLLPRRPQAALTPDVFPGNCWAFPGETGSLTIRLARAVRPTSVTIEHTPQRSVFSTLSAPRRFRVWGIPLNASRAAVAEGEMVALGEFVFDMSEGKRHLQSFVLGSEDEIEEMRAVKIEILSNHGAKHTSLYRVRVHGKAET